MINQIKNSLFTQVLLLCFLALVVWIINFYFHPDYASSPDASLYAGTAKNIIKGNGLFSPGIVPLFFGYPIPSFPFGWPPYFGPLHPLITSIFFFLFGINNLSLVLPNGLFFILTIPPLFLLAKKIYNSKTAFLASLWYIFTPSLLNYSISGMSEPLFIFLVTLVFFLLFITKNYLFWVGVVIGLSYLTKFQGILLFPPILAYFYKAKKARPSLLLFLAGFVAVLVSKKLFLPPLAQDYSTFRDHQFWTNVAFDSIIPRRQISRILTPATFNLVFSNLNLIFKKIFANLYYFFQKLFTATLPSITLLYILSFLKPDPNKPAKHLKFLTLGLTIFFLAFHLITVFDFRYLHSLLPFIIIVAVGTFLSFLEKFNQKRVFQMATIFTFLFIIIPSFTSPGWGTSIQRTLARPRKPTIISILGKIAKENTPKDAVIVSNDFAHLAWYGERKTIQWPLNLDDLKKIDQEIVPIDAIFLSSHDYQTPLEPEWQKLVDTPHDFGDFYFAKSFEIKPEENYYRIPVKAVLYLKNK